MAENNIHVVESQSFEGVSDTFDDMLAGKSFRVGGVDCLTKIDLGGEDEVMSWNVEALKGDADLSLSFSVT